MLEFQKGDNIVLQAEQERLEMAAEQERRAEQDVEERLALERRRREGEGFERALRTRLSVGDLLTMHKEGRSYSHEAILPRMKVENCSQLLFQTASTSATALNTDSSDG